MQELWQIEFSPQTEHIVAMAAAPRGERTASAVRHCLITACHCWSPSLTLWQGDILGDKTVLFKYINPNLLAVATLTPYVKRKATLTIYIIDTVKVSPPLVTRGGSRLMLSCAGHLH